MTKQACKPDNMSWLIPYLIVSDVQKTADLYQQAFGFEVVDIMNGPDGKPGHAELRYKDISIMCGAECAEYPQKKTPVHGNFHSPLALYVYVEDVDKLYAHVKKFNLPIDHDLHDAFWGDRMFAVLDHDGHQWTFATHLGQGACSVKT